MSPRRPSILPPVPTRRLGARVLALLVFLSPLTPAAGQTRALASCDGIRHDRKARKRVRTESGRIDGDQRLADARRRTLGIEKRRRLIGVVRACKPGAEKLDHERQRRSLGIAERHHGAGKRDFRVCRRPTFDIERPAFRYRLAFLSRSHDLAARYLG